MDIVTDFKKLDSRARMELLKGIFSNLSSYETMITKRLLLQSHQGRFDIMISVPEDIVRIILQYFCLDELPVLQSVSKEWKDLVYRSGIINTKIIQLYNSEYEENLNIVANSPASLYNKEKNWRTGNASKSVLINACNNQYVAIKNFTLKGPYLLVGYVNQRVQIFDTSNNTITSKLSKTMNVPIYSDICPIKKVTALVFFCRECVIVDIETSNIVYRLKSLTGPISCVSISGDFLIIGKCSGFLEIYNWKTAKKFLYSSISKQEIKAVCIFPHTSLLFSVAYDNKLEIYSFVDMKLVNIYSDNLNYVFDSITNKTSIGIWQKPTSSIKKSTKMYCMTIKFSSVVLRYFFSIKNYCQISLQSQNYMNINPFGCYHVHPLRAIFANDMAKNSISIVNFASPEFKDTKAIDFDYLSGLNITGQQHVTNAAINSQLLVLGFSNEI
ncbi:hypothetical protein BB561_002398 [Smittium simulii]|uniref:F-box domain-containing protein n=1 Tax=Smittium simulii TaxID=133385 RepID=A0A2T9YQN1_9FUNG|nr:hypothetical protein BB561_002398 [Smittium simulii]